VERSRDEQANLSRGYETEFQARQKGESIGVYLREFSDLDDREIRLGHPVSCWFIQLESALNYINQRGTILSLVTPIHV
jgi:hypothetical protein